LLQGANTPSPTLLGYAVASSRFKTCNFNSQFWCNLNRTWKTGTQNKIQTLFISKCPTHIKHFLIIILYQISYHIKQLQLYFHSWLLFWSDFNIKIHTIQTKIVSFRMNNTMLMFYISGIEISSFKINLIFKIDIFGWNKV